MSFRRRSFAVLAQNRKPFKSQTSGSCREDFPTMSEATRDSATSAMLTGSLFYERGFFGIVWFEGATRKVRDLKNW